MATVFGRLRVELWRQDDDGRGCILFCFLAKDDSDMGAEG